METSSLPEISDPEFKRSVSALANAAYLMRGGLVDAAKGKPVADIIDARFEDLQISSEVIVSWCRHLDIKMDDHQER